MKVATKQIVDKFPMLKTKLPDHESVLLSEETLKHLSDTEQFFLRMAWFFENPRKENFNLNTLFDQIDEEWLSFALESINVFFKRDTYLLDQTDFSIITEDSMYYSQSDFATYLNEHGFNYSRPKINTYKSRGTIPPPDITVSNVPYWELSTCESYLRELQHERAR